MGDPFETTVEATLRRYGMIAAGEPVLIAVSGGADSVALAAVLARIRPGARQVLVHANHRLRGAEAEADARFVEELADRLSLDVRILDCAVGDGPNLEERAREERYRRLREVAREGGFRRIATGHTRDDQAETFLLRLLRGSGTAGLAGIDPVRADGVVRPLFETTRLDVTAYLERRRLPFRTDRTNADPRFLRNRIRHRLLPFLEQEFHPAVRRLLARTADLARDDENRLAAEARWLLERSSPGDALCRADLARSAPALARRMAREWLRRTRGDLRRLTAQHLDRVVRLAAAGGAGGSVSLPGGSVVVDGDWLLWNPPAEAPEAVRLHPGETVVFGSWRIAARPGTVPEDLSPGTIGPWSAVVDGDRVDGTSLLIRGVRPGDRVRPLGLGGTRKLQDVFVDGKVPRHRRRQWPVIATGRSVLWLPGLVRSEFAPVTSTTRWTIHLEAHPPA